MSFSIDANSAISSALSGLQSNSRVLDRAANNISKTAVSSTERSTFGSDSKLESSVQGVMESASYEPSLSQNIMDTMMASNLYTANARVIEASNAMTGSALNILV